MEENIKNDKVFNSNEYKTVTLQNIMRTISVLKATGSSFQIRVPKNKVGFSPLLPKEIEINEPKKKFQSKVKVSKYSNNDKGIF